MLNIPRQNSYEGTLTQKLEGSASALTIYCDDVPDCTIPSGVYLEMTINPTKGFTKQEVVLIESIDTTNNKMTIKSGGRAQDRYNGDSPMALEHGVGSKIVLSNPYSVWVDVETAIDGKMSATGGTFTGDVDFSGSSTTFRVPNLTTAERDALSSPANGMFIYNTTTGTVQYYDGGTWNDVGTATVNNASETVAGIIELATNSEMGSGTSTGATGARLVAPNDQLVKTSSGASDENKIAVLGSDGKYASGFIPTIAAEQMSFTGTAGEAIDGTTTPQAVYVSDGSNSRTAGRVYKADADDFTNMSIRFVGFVTSSVSAGDSVTVYKGLVGGFSGLTQGVEYYLSTTAGGVVNSNNNVTVPVGIAVSATEILTYVDTKIANVTHSTSLVAASMPLTVTSDIGFRAKTIIAMLGNQNGSAFSHSIGFYAGGTGTLMTSLGSSDMADTDLHTGAMGSTGFRLYTDNVGGTTQEYYYMTIGNITNTSFDVTWNYSGSANNITANVYFLILG